MSGETKDMAEKCIPLMLLDMSEGGVINGITRFQKLVFLAQEGGLKGDKFTPMNEYFDYEAFDYGPFSKELYDCLDQLDDEGLINSHEETTSTGNQRWVYELTQEGDSFVDECHSKDLNKERTALKTSIDRYGDMPLFELLDKVYATYPKYARSSKLRA